LSTPYSGRVRVVSRLSWLLGVLSMVAALAAMAFGGGGGRRVVESVRGSAVLRLPRGVADVRHSAEPAVRSLPGDVRRERVRPRTGTDLRGGERGKSFLPGTTVTGHAGDVTCSPSLPRSAWPGSRTWSAPPDQVTSPGSSARTRAWRPTRSTSGLSCRWSASRPYSCCDGHRSATCWR